MPDALISRITSLGPGVGSGNSLSSSFRSPRKTTPFMVSSGALSSCVPEILSTASSDARIPRPRSLAESYLTRLLFRQIVPVIGARLAPVVGLDDGRRILMIPLDINGKRQTVDLPGETPLLWTLRDELGLTGTKFGCGMALCGACTVHVDGQAVRSCITPISAVANKKVVTIEAVGADAKKYGADGMPNGWVDDPLAFVAIAEDGTVTIVCHRSEMGQGVRTGMPMIVADELEADWKRVRVAQAHGDEKKFGNQDTDGSRSTRHFFEPMRRCGAAARTMLEAAAAERWNVPVSEVEAKNHEVVHRPTGRRAGYGSLAKAAAGQPVPARETLRLKDPKQFRYIGKGQLKLVDGRDIATGKAQYGIDTRLDGMLYAVVARPPVYGGKVASFDPAEALKVPGVQKVVQIEDSPPPAHFNPVGGVAVLARNTWAAMQGRKALKITWDDGPNASYDSSAFKTSLEESARKPGKVVRNDGDFDAAVAKAARRLDAEYYVPHLAHATMEPPAATVRITNGKCDVWGCFQSPQAARDLVAKRPRMSADH